MKRKIGGERGSFYTHPSGENGVGRKSGEGGEVVAWTEKRREEGETGVRAGADLPGVDERLLGTFGAAKL